MIRFEFSAFLKVRSLGEKQQTSEIRKRIWASYLDRYNILCRKLTQERLYTTATVMESPRTAADSGDYVDLSEFSSLKMFITSFAGHIAAEAARE